jgi:beta-galactosidase
MGFFPQLNYWKFAEHLDVISDDCYPSYHDRGEADVEEAVRFSMAHDMCRSLKQQPFMVMESSPSATNWMSVHKVKRPGVHRAQAMQHLGHGAETVKYFQWRKGRGSHEKFHGAVVDHVGHEHTRVFEDVADLGGALAKLDGIIGTMPRVKAALICDWEVRWALEASCGPMADTGRGGDKEYMDRCRAHYRPLWQAGVSVDVLDSDRPFDGYDLLIAPMLYMVRPGVAERMEQFAQGGGTVVCSTMTGWVDEANRCFLGGWPGPLRNLLGIWTEEIDALYKDERNTARMVAEIGRLGGEYVSRQYCERIHPESADVLATYAGEFYAGEPCVTVRQFGNGRAYYLATRLEQRFLDDFYNDLIEELKLPRAMDAELPHGVTAQCRTDGQTDYVFVVNLSGKATTIDLTGEEFTDVLEGETVTGSLELAGHDSAVLSRPAK